MAGCVAAKPASSASSKKNTVKQNAVVLLGIALPGSLALLVIRSIPLSQAKPGPRSIMAAAHRPETAATVRISRHGREGISYPSPPGILTKVLCIRASEEEAHERDPYPGLGPRALVVAGRACRGGPGLPPRARPCAGGSGALRTPGADAGDHACPSPGDRTAPRRRVRCCDAGARRSRADVARRPDPRGARAHAAVDRRPVARRRAGDVGAAGVGGGNGTAAGDRGNAAGLRRLAAGARPSREAAPRQPARAAARVGVDRGARSDRLVAAGDSHPGERAGGGRSHAAAARRAAGPRAGPRAAARLPRQPAANGGRDAALLPSRGVVGLDAGARGARALLRRPGGRRLWRRACLRDGAARDGAAARPTGARARGGRRLAARSRPPPPGAGDARRLPALARRRGRRGARAGGGDREWLGPASLLAGLRGFADRTRDRVP